DKYNWEEHPGHFILADVKGAVDFGEGKKNIYALEGAQVLVQKDREVQMAANEYGAGRAVYISGLPYSFENSRVLYRSILWASHSEGELHKWFSSNYNVEVYAYVKNGKYCVVNNTYEPQHTTVYTGEGSGFELDLAANEIRNQTKEGFRWGSFALPNIAEGGDGAESNNYGAQCFAINKDTQYPNAAFALVEWLTSGEWDQKLADETMGVPMANDANWPEALSDAKAVIDSTTQRLSWAVDMENDANVNAAIKTNLALMISGQLDAQGFADAFGATQKGA
uniref:lacto-N-biose phosphorylase central domain-containing protein n=1 Tax=Candidatus Allofournierella excrementigallinarum TaxID=2838592 RepID=UPI00374F7FE3